MLDNVRRDGLVTDQWAYGYAMLSSPSRAEAETRLRWTLAECSQREGLHLRDVFIDEKGQPPYGFAAMRELIRRRGDIRAVVLPDLTHIQHILSLTGLSPGALARYLGIGVLLVAPAC